MNILEYILKFDTLIAAVIAPLLGLFVYFRQKQYELVRKRYLEDGIDVILNYIEYVDSTFRHNWSRALTCLKLYRDAGSDISRDLYTNGYVELEPPTFQMSRNYILRELTGSDVFFNILQLLLAFVGNANAFIMHDLCFAIKISVEGGKENKVLMPKDKLIDAYFEKLRNLDQKSHKYALLHNELHKIATCLSKERLTFKTVESFRDKAVVKLGVSNLRKAFKEKLELYERQ